MLVSPLVGENSPLDKRSQDILSSLIQASSERVRTLPSDDPCDEKRYARVKYTLEEMNKQKEAIQSTLESEKQTICAVADAISKKGVDHIYMVGCGDSLFSMIGVRAFLERMLEIPCEPMQALDFAYYNSHLVNEKTAVITLSSSGKTPRTMEAQLMARKKGATTIALTNTLGTPMMDEADHSLYIHAERKGWPTQSSTAAMAILYQLGFEIGRQKTQQVEWLSDLEAEFKATVDLINPVLDDLEGSIASIAKNEAANDLFLFAGGGPAFTCASFGAAKTKELTSSHAIAIPLEEYHHYRSQKSGEPLFLVAPQGYSTIRARDTGIKGLENGGHVYAIVTKGDRTLDGSYTQRLDLPLVNELFVPLLYTLPLQQFAYYLAMEKFSLAGLV